MKKMLIVCLIALTPGLVTVSSAQQKDTTAGQKIKHGMQKTGKAIGKGATAVGNKTAELASKGSSAVIDKIYDGKAGPGGQTIYISSKSKYYWVDKKGRRHYVAKVSLKEKVEKNQ